MRKIMTGAEVTQTGCDVQFTWRGLTTSCVAPRSMHLLPPVRGLGVVHDIFKDWIRDTKPLLEVPSVIVFWVGYGWTADVCPKHRVLPSTSRIAFGARHARGSSSDTCAWIGPSWSSSEWMRGRHISA